MSRLADALTRLRPDLVPPVADEMIHETPHGTLADVTADGTRAWPVAAQLTARQQTATQPVLPEPPWEPSVLPPPPPASLRGEPASLALRLFQGDGFQVRSVVFSAVGPRAEPQPLCAWTALELAGGRSVRVCVIDADFETPTLHDAFGLECGAGLSDALVDARFALDPVGLATRVAPTLWFLPAGTRGAAARPHLTSEPFRAMLRKVAATFDCCLVQVALDDAAIVGESTDGVVLVVQANATPRRAARQAAAQLKAANIRLLGAVLTNRTFPIPEFIYRWL
jgi:Mrp family chromosome partitioning ATPase